MSNKKYWYDYEEEKRVITFIEKLNLDKGKKGQKIKLLDFQKKILCDLLCWKNPDGTRRYREGFIFLPRKNGKSFLIACIFVYSLFCDDEYGAEYIIAANSRDQANHLFDTVKNMIETNSVLQKHCRIVDSRKKILRKSTNSFLQVISSDASKADGYNCYIACQDETHEAPSDELYSKLKTSMGTRTEPLMLTITTASNGQNEYNLEYRTYLYAKKVASGQVEDDTFYSAIFEANDHCDVLDEDEWYRANPALGVFRNYDELKSLAQRAKEIPSEEATFRRMYLNQHVKMENEEAINMRKWDSKPNNLPFNIDDLKGMKCWAGLDLSTKTDVTAFVMVFEVNGEYFVIPHFFKPAETLIDHGKRDRFNYSTYANQGLLHATEGDYVHFRYVRQVINECAKDFDIQAIAFDRWGSQGIIADLQDDGFNVIDFGQGYTSMSPAIDSFYELLFDGKLRHNNNPIMKWMAEGTKVIENPSGLKKFDKGGSNRRIDGIIAMLMGLSIAVIDTADSKINYEELLDDDYLDNLGW